MQLLRKIFNLFYLLLAGILLLTACGTVTIRIAKKTKTTVRL